MLKKISVFFPYILLNFQNAFEWFDFRMLQTTRRNYPIAMQRPSWKNRGKNFSDLGVLLECGKPDLTTVKNVLHFVTSGSAKYMFNVGKELFFVPVIMVLKCLTDRSDASIYEQLTAGRRKYIFNCFFRHVQTQLIDCTLFFILPFCAKVLNK